MLKKILYTTIIYSFCFSLVIAESTDQNQTWIRINQLGYMPNSIKVAVLVSKSEIALNEFEIIETISNKVEFVSKKIASKNAYGPFISTYRLDFSDFKKQGKYYVKIDSIVSPQFEINSYVYKGSADFMLKYMRQQRCGFNPFLKDSCHTHDGFTIYGPMPDGTHLDVTGGWHDASDYLQYSATSANATLNMLLAYRDFPTSFKDENEANGLPGKNNIPDILDEANWGLEWLLKMYPKKTWLFNQIADDRDHVGFRSPVLDSTDYGKGLERPVYFCTGEVQGLQKYKNRATGVASTAGKFAAVFAAAANIYKNELKLYELYKEKALFAFALGRQKPGVCQTAPCRAPYFYEEDNWVDDMELAAAELFTLSSDISYLNEGWNFARQENITPWMGSDTARHYQWYPFFNFGHYELAINSPDEFKNELLKYYKFGIEKVYNKGKDNAFLMGVPFIWCSNNLISAFITQCYLYRKLSGDTQYLEMEAALRDWLFGCNPWGTSMVIGLPQNGVFPKDPHAALTFHYGYQLDGGLIDGPVYGSIYKSLKYVHLKNEDEFADFQSDLVVYHDDVGDYATNEPTMDGTATLIYYLAAMQNEGMNQAIGNFEYNHGGIIRGIKLEKQIAFVFTGDEYADGGQDILRILKNYNINASFFFTGNFYRNQKFKNLIKQLKSDGHYLGAHSDKHLLYCSWENRDSLLITNKSFINDLENNYKEMAKLGIEKNDAKFFLPPFEWYNQKISDWTKKFGLQLINFTPGTRSNADYTIPEMGNKYIDSKRIYDSIINFEKQQEFGLNGFILLLHIGTHPERTDKFYLLLEKLIYELKHKGYGFVRIDELLNQN
jgi:peptidoglycan/xylan/chitin deacetylase (PgdA/CDA1 family)